MADDITVLIVDDQPLVRSGLTTLLSHRSGLSVVGEACDGLGAHELARRLRPDVVVMDIRMPGVDGIEATRRIMVDPGGDTRVLVLTTFGEDTLVVEALRAGASGFLLKSADLPELERGIHVVHRGDALISPEVTRPLLQRLARSEDIVPVEPIRGTVLTERERDVVALVAGGWSNTDIAQEWVIAEVTVRTHVSRAMTKLHARDRAHLVVLAYRHGLATPIRR